MRNYAKVQIPDQLDNHDLLGLEKLNKLVDKTLLDISNSVMEQDKKIIKGMSSAELDVYMNIEMYFYLNDYVAWLDDEKADMHIPGGNCPICAEKHKAIFLIECLLKRWALQNKRKKFEELVRFRGVDATDMGRIIN